MTSLGDYLGGLNKIAFSEGAWVYNDTNQTILNGALKTHQIVHYWETNYNNKLKCKIVKYYRNKRVVKSRLRVTYDILKATSFLQ